MRHLARRVSLAVSRALLFVPSDVCQLMAEYAAHAPGSGTPVEVSLGSLTETAAAVAQCRDGMSVFLLADSDREPISEEGSPDTVPPRLSVDDDTGVLTSRHPVTGALLGCAELPRRRRWKVVQWDGGLWVVVVSAAGMQRMCARSLRPQVHTTITRRRRVAGLAPDALFHCPGTSVCYVLFPGLLLLEVSLATMRPSGRTRNLGPERDISAVMDGAGNLFVQHYGSRQMRVLLCACPQETNWQRGDSVLSPARHDRRVTLLFDRVHSSQ